MMNSKNTQTLQADLEKILNDYCEKRFQLKEMVNFLVSERDRVEAEITAFRRNIRQIVHAERIQREIGQKTGELIHTFDNHFLQTVRERRRKLEEEIDDIEWYHELCIVEIQQIEADIYAAIGATE